MKRGTLVSACLTTYIKPQNNFNTFYKRTCSIHYIFVTKQIEKKGRTTVQHARGHPPRYFLWQIQKNIQQVVGTFLYYGRALDCTMIPALNTISTQQEMPTQLTIQRAQQHLDYSYTYANVFVRIYASDTQFEVDSDAAFLVLSNSKRRIEGYFCFLHHQDSPNIRHANNGPIPVKVRTVLLFLLLQQKGKLIEFSIMQNLFYLLSTCSKKWDNHKEILQEFVRKTPHHLDLPTIILFSDIQNSGISSCIG